MARPRLPIIAITVGDFNGIGPEVALKATQKASVRKLCRSVFVGPLEVFSYYAKRFGIPAHFAGARPEELQEWKSTAIPVIQTAEALTKAISPGQISALAGEIAADAIERSVALIKQGYVHAMVTSPVSKKSMHLAGVDFPGQTEMVQHFSNSSNVVMMLVSKTMRVGLVTIHIPVKDVASTINATLIKKRIGIIHDALRIDWRIPTPKIAVLAVNPHASEGGDIGREDLDIVEPAIRACKKNKLNVEGPFPADSFFGKYKAGTYDAIVAMYHDQGLIPLKMSSFGEGVNISVGLNVVRTSPDHGTAFDIAGKGIAHPGSMIAAIQLAATVTRNRQLYRDQ